MLAFRTQDLDGTAIRTCRLGRRPQPREHRFSYWHCGAAATTCLLVLWKVDGRAAHAAGLAWIRMHMEPRRLSAFRPAPVPGRVTLARVTLPPDGGVR